MTDIYAKKYDDRTYGPTYIFFEHGRWSRPIMIVSEIELRKMLDDADHGYEVFK